MIIYERLFKEDESDNLIKKLRKLADLILDDTKKSLNNITWIGNLKTSYELYLKQLKLCYDYLYKQRYDSGDFKIDDSFFSNILEVDKIVWKAYRESENNEIVYKEAYRFQEELADLKNSGKIRDVESAYREYYSRIAIQNYKNK